MSKFKERAAALSTVLHARAGESSVQELQVADIIPDPDNPRKSFDNEKLKALARSIERRGLLQPITVRPANGDGKYIIRFGERRWRASQLGGIATIKAIVSDTATERENLVDQVVENEQRADLSTSEMVEAVQRLMSEGLTKAEVAEELSCKATDVSQYVAFPDMAGYLKGLIDAWPRRALYDLHVASRQFPSEIEGFVESRRQQGVTTAAAAAFVRELKETQRRVPGAIARAEGEAASSAPSDIDAAGPVAQARPGSSVETVPEVVHAATSPRRKGRGKAAAFVPPALTVVVDGRSGRLILPETVSVLFDGEADAVPVPTQNLRFSA